MLTSIYFLLFFSYCLQCILSNQVLPRKDFEYIVEPIEAAQTIQTLLANRPLIISSNTLISIAIDLNSDKIIYEGLRLLRSIQLFGKSMKDSPIYVCISNLSKWVHRKSLNDGSWNQYWIEKLQFEYNVKYISFSEGYSLPEFSPTLNKLCCFDLSKLETSPEIEYLIYLDADIIVAFDPYPSIQRIMLDQQLSHVQGSDKFPEIFCGRSWSPMEDIVDFPEFAGKSQK